EERAAEDDAREDAARAKAVAEPSAGDFEERVGEREGGEGPRTEDGREVEAEFDVLADLDDADASDVGDGREAAQPGQHLPAHTRGLCSDGWFRGLDGGERHLCDHSQGFHFFIIVFSSAISSVRSLGNGGRTGPAASPTMFIISFITVTSYPRRRARIAYSGITYSAMRSASSAELPAEATL